MLKRDSYYWKNILKGIAFIAAGFLFGNIADHMDDIGNLFYFIAVVLVVIGVVVIVREEKDFNQRRKIAHHEALTRSSKETARKLYLQKEQSKTLPLTGTCTNMELEQQECDRKYSEIEHARQTRIEAELKKRQEAKANFAEDMNMLNEICVQVSVSDQLSARRLVSEMPLFHFTNITKATNFQKIFPIVVLDVETTGLKVRGDSIIEVSAIKYEEKFTSPTSCFTSLVKPKKPIPASATAVNGITDEMVSGAPYFEQIADSFSKYIEGCNVLGHNLPFDLKFLFCGGVRFSEKMRYYDTLDLVKRTLDRETDVYDYKLDTLAEYFGIYRDNAHRSLSDCFATSFVFRGLVYLRTDRMID